MRHGVPAMCASVPLVLLFVSICFADNPIVQTSFTADPAPMVYNDTLYLYAGDDSLCAATLTGFFMRYWKCYTTTDMVNWTYRAIILPTSTISWSTGDANAAQCVYRNGQFYFYFPTGSTTDNGLCCLGVATATNPLGPFTDIGHPLILGSQMTGCNATHGWRGLDPTVWIDDDGQAYMYWGNNVCYWVRLNTTMTSFSGSITCIAQNDPAFGPDYEEAPWLFKRNGLWYLLYASKIPENIEYSTSTSPTGPWTYRNRIMTPVTNGNHPGYIEYKGNSYLFSFKDGTNGLPGGTNYRRAICVEKFSFNADGTIPTVVFSNSSPPQLQNLNPYNTVQAETICWASGLRAQPCSEGGMNIDSVHNGDYIKVKGVDFGSGANSFSARVASATSGGNIELRLDTTTGTLVGTCVVAGTGGWQTWATQTCSVTGATGIHNLFLRFTGSSGLLFNFNWWRFNPTVGTIQARGTESGKLNSIKAVTTGGKTQELLLYFSQSVFWGQVKVCLFDVKGRLVTTLFSGRLTSPQLALPLNRAKIRTGAYLIRVSLGNDIFIKNSMIINE
jgi:arabinoxylan arabinofuranohydrolase